jgi:cohesin loading factor subunit SCC2
MSFMVLSNLLFTDPTPVTPTPKPSVKQKSLTKSVVPTATANGVSAEDCNRQAFVQNSSILNPKSSPPDPKRPQPIVLIPSLPLSSRHDDYVELPSNRQSIQDPSASRRKNRQDEEDAALSKFQDLLHDIFDAEDQLQLDSSLVNSADSGNLFVRTNVSESSPYAISPAIQFKLQSQVHKLVEYDRFGDVLLDDIIRLQSLCQRPLTATQTLALKPDSDFSDSDIEDWLQKLDLAEHGLVSAGTLIRIMMANRAEKELRSEEDVLAIPNALANVFENCVILVVESRSQGKDSVLFSIFSTQKKVLSDLMQRAKKILTLFSNLVSQVEVVEEAITTTEFLAAKLLFVENAHSEKDAIFGIAKYEALRRGAMDVLAKIFSRYPEQRSFILDEILASLEKLPQTQKSARQFKLGDGKNIQLLTALVMQLVQTTTLQADTFSATKKRRVLNLNGNSNHDAMAVDNEDEEQHGDEDDPPSGGKAVTNGAAVHADIPEALSSKLEPLHENALRSAQYVVKYFVQRAMTSTKTGDQPYRNLFDLFTEDLLSVLNSTDWPAAELILRLLASHMIGISNHDKSTALAKNMALEVLGWMGAAISDTIASLQHFGSTIDRSSSKTSDYLYQAIDSQLRGTSNIEDVVDPNGPFRVTLEYMQERDVDDWLLSSARSFYLVQWAKTVSIRLQALDDEDEEDGSRMALEESATLLVKILSDRKWLETESDFESVSTSEGRAAYTITILNMGFCKAYDAIVNVLLGSFTSDQIKIRNRSLKSVVTMLEKDSTLLDRQSDIMRVIFRCASDQSPMVRDSALSLIGKCILLKPGLETEACRVIMNSMDDQAVGVRKRCIGLLKDMYLRNPRMDVKAAIAESLLLRMRDTEDPVRDLAQQMIEDAWFMPYVSTVNSLNESAKAKVAFREHAALIVKCIQRGGDVIPCFELFLGKIIAETAKNSAADAKVCKALVGTLFDALVEGSQFPGNLEQKSVLQTITIFAKADAKLFSPDQLRFLQPYIGNLSSQDDLFLFRSAVIIFRCVLPSLSAAQSEFLKEVQNDLLKSIPKLARAELNEVMACLWTINLVLNNPERLVRLTVSVLKGIYENREKKLGDPQNADALNRVRSYVRIAGSVGKYCDLDDFANAFKEKFQWWKGGSVAGLMVDLILTFVPLPQPNSLRTMALESLVSICQSWPAQFSRNIVRNMLDSIFSETNGDLKNIILKTFAEFFTIHEGKQEKVANFDGPAEVTADARFGASMKASDTDGAVAMIAQHFLKDIVHVCLSRQDPYGLTAMEVVASINRQGLVHPKECTGVWVASETSTNPEIAKIAYDTHLKLHQQHETMFEREYMRAIRDAFVYQREVVGDCSGATKNPYRSKLSLLFDIVKISNAKYQKKFLSNLCMKIDFEPGKLECSDDMPDHLLYANFLIQNLAFFEYGRMEELVHAISSMEKVVAQTGTGIAHAIDTEVFRATMIVDQTQEFHKASADQNSVEPARLRHLTTCSMVLSLLWEARTFLRKLYGVSSSHVQRDKKSSQAKDMSKAPTKMHGVTGDKFWESTSRIMGALTNGETMIFQCQEFSKLLSIDEEVKVAAEDDEERLSLDSESVDLENGAPIAAGGKRKGSVSASGTPKKPRKRGRPSSGKQRKSSNAFDDDAEGWD